MSRDRKKAEYIALGEVSGWDKRRWFATLRNWDGSIGRWSFLKRTPEDLTKWGNRPYGTSATGCVRCAIIKKSGHRCANWSLRGSLYCRKHFGYRNRDRMPYVKDMLLNQAVSDATPELVHRMKDFGISAKDLETGTQEAILARAIVGEAMRDLCRAGGLIESKPQVGATLGLKLLKESQALVLGATEARVKYEKWIPIEDLHQMLNMIVGIIAGEVRRLTETDKQADQSLRRVIAAFLSLEINGEPLFDLPRLISGDLSHSGEKRLDQIAEDLVQGRTLQDALTETPQATTSDNEDAEDDIEAKEAIDALSHQGKKLLSPLLVADEEASAVVEGSVVQTPIRSEEHETSINE